MVTPIDSQPPSGLSIIQHRSGQPNDRRIDFLATLRMAGNTATASRSRAARQVVTVCNSEIRDVMQLRWVKAQIDQGMQTAQADRRRAPGSVW